jgi:hypothetical protein
MTWDKSCFFEAFQAVGFLTEVVISTGPDSGRSVWADYREPAQTLWDGIVQATEYSIRYQMADIVLKRDIEMAINGKNFRVSQTPKASGDGTTYCTAALEWIKP